MVFSIERPNTAFTTSYILICDVTVVNEPIIAIYRVIVVSLYVYPTKGLKN